MLSFAKLKGAEIPEEVSKLANERVVASLAGLDKILAHHKGEFIVNDHVTIADL